MSRPRIPLIAWVGATYLLGFALWLTFGWGGPDVLSVVSDLGSLGLEFLAII